MQFGLWKLVAKMRCAQLMRHFLLSAIMLTQCYNDNFADNGLSI
jgi:hypothetical protein